MNIAYFTDTYKPQINGVTFSVSTFAEYLSPEHSVHVYAPSYGLRGSTESEGSFVVERFTSFPFPTYKDIQISTPNIIKLVRSVYKFKPDVIHFHTPGVLGIIAILLAKRMNVPLIGTYHTLFSEQMMYLSPSIVLNSVALKINGVIDSIQKTGGDSSTIKNLLQKLDYIKAKYPLEHDVTKEESSEVKKLVWDVLNGLFNTCDMVIAPSLPIKNALESRGLKKPVEVVSNGIDLASFPAKSSYESTQKILYVGRVSFEKNIDVVIKAFARVLEKAPDAHLTIAGDGPALDSLKELAKKLGISKSVTFLGWIDRSQLSELYRSHDVFVTASTMETQGIVLLEALASGLPAVGVNKYAVPDIVRDGVNGYIVEPFDDEKFAERIVRLITVPEICKTFGEHAVLSVEEHDITRNIEKIATIYTSLARD